MAKKRLPKDFVNLVGNIPDPQTKPMGVPVKVDDFLSGKIPAKDPRTPDESIPFDKDFAKVDIDSVFNDQYIAASKVARARTVLNELAKRSIEAVRLYEPLPEQLAFHKCKSAYRVIRGSNRSGKTLSAAVEFALAVTGQDPYCKYPLRDGVAVIVGKDQRHIGKVMYQKLFRSNSTFKIVRDSVTKKWRAWKPWLPEDANRESETKYAPPLIPQRFIKEIAWENKKENVPSVIRLVNGWELLFFSSLGKPPQGFPCDLFWFDEEIIDPAWYPEMAARSVDRNGRGIWSATPQAGTDQLYELHERAMKEKATLPEDKRRISEFVVLISDNKFMSEESKKNFIADLSEEERRVRVDGEFALTSFKVYPTFNTIIHALPYFEIPSTWTRYAYVDPGHRTCAVLFTAVPPTDYHDQMKLIYSELYLKEVNAFIFAEAMRRACEFQTIQAFVIDSHMALQTEMGIGKTVLQQYTEALANAKVKSVSTGSSFIFANDDIDAGVLAVQSMLRVRENGKPMLRVFEQSCPNFLYEIKRYHRRRVGGVVQERPDNRADNHLMDCLRYMALHDPKWVKTKDAKQELSASYKMFKEKQKRLAAKDGSDGVIRLGPGGRLY